MQYGGATGFGVVEKHLIEFAAQVAVKSGTVFEIAAEILPPPNCSGSANPLTKSTTRTAGLAPNPLLLPKPWRL